MADGLASAIGWPEQWASGFAETPARMEIDVADAEALREWRAAGGWCAGGFDDRGSTSIDRIIAAIPTPPWEPDKEVVETYIEAIGQIEPGSADGYAKALRYLHDQGWHLVKDSDG